MKKWTRWSIVAAMLVATMGLVGCDDGSDGAAGLSAYEIAVANGFVGTEQEWLDSLQGASGAVTTAEPESCAVCHSDVAGSHAATGVPEIVGAVGVLDGITGDYTITVQLEVDGVGTNEGYQLYRVYKTYDDPLLPQPAITTLVRDALLSLRNENASDCTDSDNCTIENSLGDFGSAADGTFTLTVPAAEVETDAAYTVIIRSLDPADTYGWGHLEPGAVVTLGTSPLRDLVSDDGNTVGCAACHGASASSLFDHYLVKGNECQACHTRHNNNAEIRTKDENGDVVTTGTLAGGNFTEYIHGIHNSHSMPDGVYYRTSAPDDDLEEGDRFSVGYPSAMRNCKSCHVSPAQLDAAVTAPVSFYLCMTCHQSWDGFVHGHDGATYEAGDMIFDDSTLTKTLHRTYGMDTNCMACHETSTLFDEAGDFHNDFQATDAHYNSFYRGVDISFANPDDLSIEITGVTSNGSNVSFTWTAKLGATAVNPCNTTVAAGAPTFQSLGAYLAYAKGDDWVNEFVGSSPGQPASARNLFTSLATTCASNVATTTGLVLDPDTGYADKVLLAIGGKPLAKFSTGDNYFVRVPSPVYAFDPADGASVAARRNAVNNDKCLGCHQGTLYQHGGDRVDNEQLCVICHNPSSNDKNNRLDRFQIVNADGTVNTDATYDNKVAETYDMRVMLHGIHGVEQRLETDGKPWTIYRSRGIYAFALEDTPKPIGWPDDGMTIYGSTNDSTIAHNWTVVHYPKPVNDCAACHNDGEYEAADQTKAVGVTIDAGTDWPDQSDDIIIGPSAAACTACHAGAAYRSHAQTFGYKANVTKDEMLDKAQ